MTTKTIAIGVLLAAAWGVVLWGQTVNPRGLNDVCAQLEGCNALTVKEATMSPLMAGRFVIDANIDRKAIGELTADRLKEEILAATARKYGSAFPVAKTFWAIGFGSLDVIVSAQNEERRHVR